MSKEKIDFIKKNENNCSFGGIAFFRPDNEWREIALACAHTSQYLFRCAIVACAKLCMTS